MITIGEATGFRKRKPWHDGKHIHKSERAAHVALRTIHARGERENGAALRNGETLNVYRCWEGGTLHYHVGHRRESRGEENNSQSATDAATITGIGQAQERSEGRKARRERDAQGWR